MQPYLSVEAREDEARTLLVVEGELDLGSAPRLEEALKQAQDSGPPLIVVDLRSLEFMDMAGLRVLVAAHQQAERAGRRVVLANVRGAVRRVLELTNVDKALTILDER